MTAIEYAAAPAAAFSNRNAKLAKEVREDINIKDPSRNRMRRKISTSTTVSSVELSALSSNAYNLCDFVCASSFQLKYQPSMASERPSPDFT